MRVPHCDWCQKKMFNVVSGEDASVGIPYSVRSRWNGPWDFCSAACLLEWALIEARAQDIPSSPTLHPIPRLRHRPSRPDYDPFPATGSVPSGYQVPKT